MPTMPTTPTTISLLDYGGGNVRSVHNALLSLGHLVETVNSPSSVLSSSILIFPGVGSFGSAMRVLRERGLDGALREYIEGGGWYFGICLGMQTLFESSEESPGVEGLGVIEGVVRKFNFEQSGDGSATSSVTSGTSVTSVTSGHSSSPRWSVPHIGWNQATVHKPSSRIFTNTDPDTDAHVNTHVNTHPDPFYFVHSYRLPLSELSGTSPECVLSTTSYGPDVFVSSVQKGRVLACQFHPEKSGEAGLRLLRNFIDAATEGLERKAQGDLDGDLEGDLDGDLDASSSPSTLTLTQYTQQHAQQQRTQPTPPTKRLIAALDVRSDDSGKLVVTKGFSYDVREGDGGAVRDLGDPVAMAGSYYSSGVDEIAFLNITSFRCCALDDLPMLKILEGASNEVRVPLTVGGGIRDGTGEDGEVVPALEVAGRYFRAGADKVSIGGDAVEASLKLIRRKGVKDGTSSIESISRVYGSQAVVVSVDPKRVYLPSVDEKPEWVPEDGVVTLRKEDGDILGPEGEDCCYYQCTVKGGRETRPLDVVALVESVTTLGAGEIMLNSIDQDGRGNGYDHVLISLAKRHTTIPIIASSGCGRAEHVVDVFRETGCEAALVAGVFHRGEVTVGEVKEKMKRAGVQTAR